jgi:OOP family OmpA-OmpF porin
MKMLDYLFALIALAGLLATGWWGLYQSPQRPANLAAQLEQDANATLTQKGFDWAHVRMNGQRAVLLGAAPSDDAAMDAAEAVLHAAWGGGVILGGVTVVEVAVDPARPVSPYVWRAEKMPDGRIVLSGHVPSRRIAEQVEAEATRLSEGVPPESHMQVAAGSPGGNWQGVARFGLDLLDELESGEVRLMDDTLRVSGLAPDPAERARLSAKVSSLTAPYRGEPLIHGLPVWSAVQTGDGLVLSGKVHSEDERRELLGIAQANYGGSVIDQMELASAMPTGWLDSVRAGLPHFARFREGEMGVYPGEGDVGLAVEGEAPASTLEYLRQDMTSAGGDWPATIWAYPVNVTVPEVGGIRFDADPAGACQKAFDAVLAANPIRFDAGSAVLSRENGAALDKLLTVSHLCPSGLILGVRGHGDMETGPDADNALGKARADAIVTFMLAAGFDPARMSALDYGPDPSAQSIDAEADRAANRFIEYRVQTRSE